MTQTTDEGGWPVNALLPDMDALRSIGGHQSARAVYRAA